MRTNPRGRGGVASITLIRTASAVTPPAPLVGGSLSLAALAVWPVETAADPETLADPRQHWAGTPWAPTSGTMDQAGRTQTLRPPFLHNIKDKIS